MSDGPLCRVCGCELNDTNWYPSSKRQSDYSCKKCNVERARKWREANPEHKEKRREYWLKWYDSNREKVREQQRKYIENNREKWRETQLKSQTCRILKTHAENLKGDPERLSTDFIIGLCGLEKEDCSEAHK